MFWERKSGSASGSGLTSATINGYINGQPIGTFFLKEFTGINDKGLSVFRDVDGDGIISDKDRVALGSALPSTIYSLFGDLGYKGFDFSLNFNGISGNKIYDNTANSNFYKLKLSKGVNVTPDALDEPKESTSNAAPVSSRYLQNGAYFRLNNVSLGYNLNPSLNTLSPLSSIPVNSLRKKVPIGCPLIYPLMVAEVKPDPEAEPDGITD